VDRWIDLLGDWLDDQGFAEPDFAGFVLAPNCAI
jgi:hypothetical protein